MLQKLQSTLKSMRYSYLAERAHDTGPILVLVEDGRWESYCPVPITPRARLLQILLEEAGGINEGVVEGFYYFHAERAGWNYRVWLEGPLDPDEFQEIRG